MKCKKETASGINEWQIKVKQARDWSNYDDKWDESHWSSQESLHYAERRTRGRGGGRGRKIVSHVNLLWGRISLFSFSCSLDREAKKSSLNSGTHFLPLRLCVPLHEVESEIGKAFNWREERKQLTFEETVNEMKCTTKRMAEETRKNRDSESEKRKK